MNKILMVVGAVVVLCVGTLVAASQAVPGDMLYGMKTGFMEQTEARFAGEGRARVDWQIKIAERRLDEAVRSAEKGKFNADVQESVLLSFNQQMQEIEAYMVAAHEEGRSDEVKEVAVKLGQMLADKTVALTTLQTEINASADTTVHGSLDLLVARATNSLTATAFIAAGTLIEDEAPEPEIDPSTVDEFGRPI